MTISSNGTPTLAAASPSANMSVTGTWGSGQSRTANDLLLAFVTLYGTTTANLGIAPSGWLLERTAVESSRCITALYKRVATGSDTAPVFTGTTTGTAADSSLQCVLYDLPDSSGNIPLLVAEGVLTGTSGTITPATTQEATGSGCMGIAAAICANGTTAATTTWTTPSGWTLGADQVASSQSQMSTYFTSTAPTSGSAKSITFTHSRTSTFQSAMVVVVTPPANPGLATYYVSTSGSDSNLGTSSGSPWLTVAKVNAATLNPGDTVLFNGGQTWSGTTLAPTASGTGDLPITFGSYGTGQADITNGSNHALYFYDVGGFVIENLTMGGITGSNTSYAGIWIEAGSIGQLNGFTLSNITATSWQYGIIVYADGYVPLDGYSNITITGCVTSGNVQAGIFLSFGGSFSGSAPAYNFYNVTVTNCTSYNNLGLASQTGEPTGFGIYVTSVQYATVSDCISYGNGSGNGNTSSGPCGLMIGNSNTVLVTNCVSYSNHTGTGSALVDGQGFDLDLDCTNCTLEYCIAYGNDGAGAYGFGGSDGFWSGNTYRYNILWGNAQAYSAGVFGDFTFFSTGTMSATYVYGNTIVSRDNGSNLVSPVLLNCTLSGCFIWNNIFYSDTAEIIYSYDAFATTSVNFQGNCYWSAGTFSIGWSASTYTSLATWIAASSQEKLSGNTVGINVNPQLVSFSAQPGVTTYSSLAPATTLYLRPGSPCASTGINLLSNFSISPGTRDFFGNILSVPLPIGAAMPVLSIPVIINLEALRRASLW